MREVDRLLGTDDMDRLLVDDRDPDDRQARLINDWSRLRFGLRYFNKKANKLIDLSPRQNQNHQWVSDVDERANKFRILFKDKQSRELSDKGMQTGKIEFKLEFDMTPEVDRDDFEFGFDLDVTVPKLCDGGYLSQLVQSIIPTKPAQCDMVANKFMLDNYHKPQGESK